MAINEDVIAWLVPATHCAAADKVMNNPANQSRIVATSDLPTLLPQISNSMTGITPSRAIQLCFNKAPKNHGRFMIGTDPKTCDIVFPKLYDASPSTPEVSSQHCSIGFDSENRLTLDDISEWGTEVSYDWESSGRNTDFCWLLSGGNSGGFPSSVRNITIDILGARFQVFINPHTHTLQQWQSFVTKIDLMTELAYQDPEAFTMPSIFMIAPSEGDALEAYLWNSDCPWQPLVRVVDVLNSEPYISLHN